MMASTIEFDDQSVSLAVEIDDIRSPRVLTAEFLPQSAVMEGNPQRVRSGPVE